ncbi:MAG: aspartate-semialdehyde dehydrogenase [Bacteriovorax sp.]|nr:aspartate-semialdehyde dehydrogenase [Bacteriovorax sp.]
MKKLGIIGWRGMVGQVLMEQMIAASDFKHFETTFFSTSQIGEKNPIDVANSNPILGDAYNIEQLKKMDIILTAQGGDYTEKIHPQLRTSGFKGFWIDAASTLRMKNDAVIILDPLNKDVILRALQKNQKDFIGGNCTVSLMMLALGGLFKQEAIEWITSMTYQAASGGGARHMNELLNQMKFVTDKVVSSTPDQSAQILQVEKKVKNLLSDPAFPRENFGAPLAFNLLPWIDSELENGQSREEWKAGAEANKILQSKTLIPIDGTCVRVSTMRCHSQALTIKLKKDIPIDEIESMIREHNEWVKFVPNTKSETLKFLTPEFASGSLSIPVGRVRKMNLGPTYLNAFTVGDQLLWGAAEPLRRMLHILLEQ